MPRTFRGSLFLAGIASVALVAAACGSAANQGPTWTFTPVAAEPVAAQGPAVAPTLEPAQAPANAATVPVSLSEFKVAVPATLPAGSVTFYITNSGAMEHEMLIFKSDLAPAAYPTDANGRIVEDGPGITLVSDGANIAPKGTQTRTVDLSAPGTYLFVCNLPGHFKMGMYTVVTVTP